MRLVEELKKWFSYHTDLRLILHTTSNSLKYSFKIVIFTFLAGLFILLAAMQAGRINNIPFGYLTKDMATVLKGPSYIGIISFFGIIAWFGTGAIALFTYFLKRSKSRKQHREFFLFSAFLMFMFGMDDLLLFHEGIYELYFFLMYAVLMSVYILRYFSFFLRSVHVISFILTLVFFGLSLIMDMNFFHMRYSDLFFLLEDGSKFIGIIFWSVFIVNHCFDFLDHSTSGIEALPTEFETRKSVTV